MVKKEKVEYSKEEFNSKEKSSLHHMEAQSFHAK